MNTLTKSSEEMIENLKDLNFDMNPEAINNPQDMFANISEVEGIDPSKVFENIAKMKNVLILDVRHQEQFAKEHIPNSIFIGIDGSFAPWVGTIIEDVTKPILLVTPDDRVEETVTRLARVGFDNSLGYLKGGIKNWKMQGKLTTNVNQIDSVVLKKLIQKLFQLIANTMLSFNV